MIKQNSAQIARHHPEKVNVLYECQCKSTRKCRHHFSYQLPFDVFLLCYKCHGAEHAEINRFYKRLYGSRRIPIVKFKIDLDRFRINRVDLLKETENCVYLLENTPRLIVTKRILKNDYRSILFDDFNSALVFLRILICLNLNRPPAP